MKKALVALSGGMDSATLLAWCIKAFDSVEVVLFNYGSKHNQYELKAASNLISHYQVKSHFIDLTEAMSGFNSNLLKSGGDIPEGHYSAPTMSQTVVPCRNMIFLSFLAGLAESIGADTIAIGIHSGDHAIYPDCRPEFYHAMKQAIFLATDQKVVLDAPFLDMNKTSILQWGVPNGVPYHLTRTCYKDQPISCGKCGSCNERLEAWAEIGSKDPIEYEV